MPFLVLLSRHAKRSFFVLGLGATIMLCMHYVDMYWLVMPEMGPTGPTVQTVLGTAFVADSIPLVLQRYTTAFCGEITKTTKDHSFSGGTNLVCQL